MHRLTARRLTMRALAIPAAVALTAALVGALVAHVPGAALGVAGSLALIALLWLVHRHPTRVVPYWVFVLLVAATKYRIRDASDSLAGTLDSQVVLELALYALLAAVLAVVVHATRVRLLPLRPIERVVAGWLGIVLLSPLWSNAPTLSAVRGAEIALHAAAVVVFTRLRTPAELLRALAVALTGYVLGCAGLAVVVPQASGTQANDYEGVARFSWFAVHPITAATMATTAAVLLAVPLLDRAPARRWAQRLLAAVTVAALLGIAVATHSRGPLVAALAALVLAFLVLHMRWPAIIALSAGTAAAGLLVASSGLEVTRTFAHYVGERSWLGRLVFRGQDADQVAGFSGRRELWDHVLRLIADRPLLGRGYQGARADLLRVVPWAGHAHNALLQATLDVGVFGAALVVVLLVSTASVGPLRPRVPAELRVARATVLALAVYQLLNAVSSESFSGAPGLDTFVFLLCAGLAQQLREPSVTRGVMRAVPPAPGVPNAIVPVGIAATLGAPPMRSA